MDCKSMTPFKRFHGKNLPEEHEGCEHIWASPGPAQCLVGDPLPLWKYHWITADTNEEVLLDPGEQI